MDSEDRFGLDDETNPNQLAAVAGKFVPQPLARRGLAVNVSTDRDRYARDEQVDIAIELRNRLPVPVTVATPQRRLWGWSVDGYLEASDERRYDDGEPGQFEFRARERKRFLRRWDGRIKHEQAGSPTRWEQATGELEIAAFVAVAGDRPTDTTTIRIE